MYNLISRVVFRLGQSFASFELIGWVVERLRCTMLDVLVIDWRLPGVFSGDAFVSSISDIRWSIIALLSIHLIPSLSKILLLLQCCIEYFLWNKYLFPSLRVAWSHRLVCLYGISIVRRFTTILSGYYSGRLCRWNWLLSNFLELLLGCNVWSFSHVLLSLLLSNQL